MFRRRDNLIKVEGCTFRDVPQQLLVTNDIAALFLEHFVEFLICKHTNLHFFTCSARQNTSASHILVTLSRVHIERQNQLHRLGELALFRDMLKMRENLINREFLI